MHVFMKVVFKGAHNTAVTDAKRDILHAFSKGVESAGDTLSYETFDVDPESEALVIWNGLKGNLKRVADRFREAKKPVVILETPLLNRDVDPQSYASARVGIDHICYKLGNFNLPKVADSIRFDKLGIEFKPWRKSGEHIVIAMQLSDDASLCDVNIFDWITRCVGLIRKHSKRPIIIKSHPMIYKNPKNSPVRDMEASELKRLAKKLRVSIFESAEDDSRFDVLENCWAVVCLTTGLAIDCVVKGIPTITTHPGNFMSPIQSRKMAEIESPKMPSREPWFNRLAYAQWSIEECADGTAWKHIREALR